MSVSFITNLDYMVAQQRYLLKDCPDQLFEQTAWAAYLELCGNDRSIALRNLLTLGQADSPPPWFTTIDPAYRASASYKKDLKIYEVSRRMVASFKARLLSGELQLEGFHAPTHAWQRFEPEVTQSLRIDFEADAVSYHGQTYGSCRIGETLTISIPILDRATGWLNARRADRYPGQAELRRELAQEFGPSMTDRVYKDLLKRVFGCGPGQKIVSRW